MTLNIAQLQQRLAGAHFHDFKQLNESIIRSTRKDNDKDFAVYYFDISQELPWTKEELAKYQDQMIGKYYFEGSKSLQWNSYLYFIANQNLIDSENFLKKKEFVEKNRIYARKFVIPEEELDSVLKPKAITPVVTGQHDNILSTWIAMLSEANIDDAVLCDATIPNKLKMIESSSLLATPSKRFELAENEDASSFISLLQLKHFRDYPLQREFEFGKVNLISGPNGAGKTSLLEAIELFYCGKNNRSDGKQPTAYTIVANMSDGQIKKASDSRPPKLFRDRNLSWYGQSEVKTNNLYQSFARYNFLDTDAAVSISDSVAHIDEELSKLLIGPEASTIWRKIERVQESVVTSLKEILPLREQLEEELESIEKKIRESSKVQPLSDAIDSRLKNMLHRLEWHCSMEEKEKLATTLISTLCEFESFARQAIEYTWINSPICVINIEKYCQDTKGIIEKVKNNVIDLEGYQKEQKNINERIKRYKVAIEMANQAKQIIASGVLRRIEDFEEQKNTVATLSDRLAGYKEELFSGFDFLDINKSIASNRKNIENVICTNEKLLNERKAEFLKVISIYGRSKKLSQELRQIAFSILENANQPNECPLCHTLFSSDELIKRINTDIDDAFEQKVNILNSENQEIDQKLNKVFSEESCLTWLEKYCQQVNFSSGTSLDSVISDIKKSKKSLDQFYIKIKALDEEIGVLKSQGFSREKFNEIHKTLSEFGSLDTASSQKSIDNLISNVNQKLKDVYQKNDEIKIQTETLKRIIADLLGINDFENYNIINMLSKLNDKLTISNRILIKLKSFMQSFSWPIDRPIAELLVEVESIHNISKELLNALEIEKRAKTDYSEALNRKKQTVEKLDGLRPRIERLSKAKEVLNIIREKNSLHSAMNKALQDNKISIESIFSQIHSPAEFQGIGSSFNSLIRKGSKQEALISEISTGQRSAFALSIFLAQNALINATTPPIILIDDPIAHVDDLNSLSFLDYLREIALTGKRQIFFSTASSKLSALFERKFDFLGPNDFKKFNLVRD